METNQTVHPKWGNYLQNQTQATKTGGLGDSGHNNTETSIPAHFLGLIPYTKRVHVGYGPVEVTDDAEVATRVFAHRCGLLKIGVVAGRNGPRYVLYLDGVPISDVGSGQLQFRFAPEELADNDGKPIVDLNFSGMGTRWGPLNHYSVSRAVCTFADEAQFAAYVDTVSRRVPDKLRCNGLEYTRSSDGSYRSDDGSILPWLVVFYLMLPSDQRPAFAAQNPEVQQAVQDQEQQSGHSETTSPADGADADFSESLSGGESGIGDSGSSGDGGGGGGGGGGE